MGNEGRARKERGVGMERNGDGTRKGREGRRAKGGEGEAGGARRGQVLIHSPTPPPPDRPPAAATMLSSK